MGDLPAPPEPQKHFNGLTHPVNEVPSYKATIEALNQLQSSAAGSQFNGLIPASRCKNLVDSVKYLKRSGVSLEEFEDKVPVIHVTGTKGKGSTCTLCESILRAHGYRTGLFTSPHLTSVRERIAINGQPLSPSVFSKYFWDVYQRLDNNKEDKEDMPKYFKFLMVMAFNVFLEEKVDVAIFEVGIGGEQDCTNVFRKTSVVGIASLGLDHTEILGNTIEEIAWGKGGIMKPNSVALTVPGHTPSALRILESRAKEKQSHLQIVPDLSVYDVDFSQFPFTHRLNLSLAIQLAHSWMQCQDRSTGGRDNGVVTKIDDRTLQGIRNCQFKGRFQHLKQGRHHFYLDGAHTRESTELCAEWFNLTSPSDGKKVLIFNATKNRSPFDLLKAFVDTNFSLAVFCSNILSSEPTKIPPDVISVSKINSSIEDGINTNLKAWQTMCQTAGKPTDTQVCMTVEETINFVNRLQETCHILVTGSIHLVGAVLIHMNPS